MPLLLPPALQYTRGVMEYKIAPSVLSADFFRLGDHVREVVDAGARLIHVDVMDGHFVPNLSMGSLVVKALRQLPDIFLDVHLMITDPAKYAVDFVKAGANHVSFHLEVNDDPVALAKELRLAGVSAGIVVNPDTSIDRALDLLPHFDMVLVMTVHPGFSGQSFLADNLEKVRRVRARERDLRARGDLSRLLDVEVDGGIDLETCVPARDAGANVFVAGSAIFDQAAPGDAVRAMERRLASCPANPPDAPTTTTPAEGNPH